MKHNMLLKVLIGLFLVVVVPGYSFGEGKPFENISFTKTLIPGLQDSIPPAATKPTAINTTNTSEEKKIKVLPKPRRQPVPVPVKVKVRPVIKPVIRPIIKPVLKIVH